MYYAWFFTGAESIDWAWMLLYDCPRGNQSHSWLDFKPTLWNRLHALDFNFVQKTMEDSTTKFLLNKDIVKVFSIFVLVDWCSS